MAVVRPAEERGAEQAEQRTGMEIRSVGDGARRGASAADWAVVRSLSL